MHKLLVDYVSDLHLGFYLPYDSSLNIKNEDLKLFIEKTIKPQAKGEVLVIAGDLYENIEITYKFLLECKNYYKKIFFVFGNHEYYMTTKEEIYKYENSINKIKKLISLAMNDDKIVILDKLNNINNGLYNYKGFTIAGDTLWYIPEGIEGWNFYLNNSNDSRLIFTNFENRDIKEQIMNLHLESMMWYDSLPDNLDLIVTHVTPVHNPSSIYPPNSCYYCHVGELKSKKWIYGHDHENADFEKAGTRFFSNPWGYYSKTFKIKTLELEKNILELSVNDKSTKTR